MNLSEAKVLITGGSSGIGLETARQLRARGAAVAVCGRREDVLAEAAAAIDAVAIAGDVSVEDDAKRIAATAIERLGGLDTLINNAGFGRFAPLLETTVDDLEAVHGTNVRGAMLMARECARHFVERAGGNIVNVSSTAGTKGFPGGTVYASSKFALSAMTECWRAELRPHDVRVMQINPSEVITEFSRNAGGAQDANPTKLHAEDIAHAILSMLAMHDRGFTTELTVFATNPK